MDGVTAMLVLVVLLAIAFDYVNGFHDTANAIATSVATRALAPRYAILMATAFNFIGAFAGTAVANTIASGLVDDAAVTQVVIAAALIGAIAWNLITWQRGLPSSSSHALIGGLLGATIIAAGTGALNDQRHRQQGADPDVHLTAARFLHRLRLHGRPVLDLQTVPAEADGEAFPTLAGRLGGVHGIRPRLE